MSNPIDPTTLSPDLRQEVDAETDREFTTDADKFQQEISTLEANQPAPTNPAPTPTPVDPTPVTPEPTPVPVDPTPVTPAPVTDPTSSGSGDTGTSATGDPGSTPAPVTPSDPVTPTPDPTSSAPTPPSDGTSGSTGGAGGTGADSGSGSATPPPPTDPSSPPIASDPGTPPVAPAPAPTPTVDPVAWGQVVSAAAALGITLDSDPSVYQETATSGGEIQMTYDGPSDTLSLPGMATINKGDTFSVPEHAMLFVEMLKNEGHMFSDSDTSTTATPAPVPPTA